MQLAQVARCRASRSDRVAALVDVAINPQTIRPSGCAEELPRPHCTRRRDGIHAVVALDQRQRCQLGRQALLLQDGFDPIAVLAGSIERLLKGRAPPRLEASDRCVDARMVDVE
jgi:hypothetical protein